MNDYKIINLLERVNNTRQVLELKELCKNTKHELSISLGLDKIWKDVVIWLSVAITENDKVVLIPKEDEDYDDIGSLVTSTCILVFNKKSRGNKYTYFDFKDDIEFNIELENIIEKYKKYIASGK